jgi:hypothetical protein
MSTSAIPSWVFDPLITQLELQAGLSHRVERAEQSNLIRGTQVIAN